MVRPTLALQTRGADRLGLFHQAGVALFLDRFGHGAGQVVGGGAFDRLEAETADAVELRLVQPVEEILEILLGLAGEAHHEGRAIARSGQISRHFLMRSSTRPRWRALHRAQHIGCGVLEGNVEIGRDQPSAISGMMSSTCG
jgi:hypothetical protein